MKKNIPFLAAMLVVGAITFAVSSLRAQTQPAPVTPPAQQAPPPNFHPMPPRGRMIGLYRQSVRMLTMAKADLQRSKDDFNGHRQSALDACTKAIQELEAVQAAISAKDAKPAEPINAPSPSATSAPSSPPATQPSH